MSTFMSFIFDEAQVRIHQDEKGMLWFVAKDVCDILGIANVPDSVGTLDEDERLLSVLPIVIPAKGFPITSTPVSESGLYALIFRSRKPEAKSFRKWVTSEVLPSIRKTGSYELRMNMDEVNSLCACRNPTSATPSAACSPRLASTATKAKERASCLIFAAFSPLPKLALHGAGTNDFLDIST